jgi:hypothetical protein
MVIVTLPQPVVKNVLGALHRRLEGILFGPVPLDRPSIDRLAAGDIELPPFVRNCPVTMHYLALLGDLPWSEFPERSTDRPWPGPTPAPRAPFAAAYLVKLDTGLRYMSDLGTFLIRHPALVWLLGFELVLDPDSPHGFDAAASLPSRRQFGRVLREMERRQLSWLLDVAVAALRDELPDQIVGDSVSLDTKHILAWVVENNPKSYVQNRFDPRRQPKADPDCRLGCKKTYNTPPEDAQPASQAKGEFYWGYASGVIVTRVDDDIEIVLAEFTQPFNEHDVTYFHPLMADTQRRLGRRPRFGALDAAFDASYVYEYFDEAGGFAAVPLVNKGGYPPRSFDEAGNPTCAAGLGMSLKRTFMNRTSYVEHERGVWTCPLIGVADACPIAHPKWAKGGCQTTMGTAVGARVRYQIDREGEAYKALYRTRTATERINSQAFELGIERPKLRSQAAIANQNTLLYVLIDLRALGRVRARSAERQAA